MGKEFDMTDEVEIKFQCSPDVITGLSQLSNLGPDYSLSLPSSSETHDTYFDTKESLLLNHGASIRCRKKEKDLKITFKSNSRFNTSAITRDEIEKAVKKEAFQALLHKGKPPSFVMPAIRKIIGGRSVKPGTWGRGGRCRKFVALNALFKTSS
jgi:inorganic triphosphatase YgiF